MRGGGRGWGFYLVLRSLPIKKYRIDPRIGRNRMTSTQISFSPDGKSFIRTLISASTGSSTMNRAMNRMSSNDPAILSAFSRFHNGVLLSGSLSMLLA